MGSFQPTVGLLCSMCAIVQKSILFISIRHIPFKIMPPDQILWVADYMMQNNSTYSTIILHILLHEVINASWHTYEIVEVLH